MLQLDPEFREHPAWLPRCPKNTFVAVAASMLTAAYDMLRDEVDDRDLGGRYFAERGPQRVMMRLIRRTRNLGVPVDVRVA